MIDPYFLEGHHSFIHFAILHYIGGRVDRGLVDYMQDGILTDFGYKEEIGFHGVIEGGENTIELYFTRSRWSSGLATRSTVFERFDEILLKFLRKDSSSLANSLHICHR